MNENKTTTYGDLKQRKAELQHEMLGGYFHNFEEYKKLLVWIKQAESVLLWSITCLIVLSVVFLHGCQTLKGATGDTAWMLQRLSDNIETQEK